MGLDLNGNKLYKTSIGPNGEVLKQIITNGLIVHLDAGNKNSYNISPIIVGAKIYSTYNGGLRSSNYSVQYSDNNSTWTTAFTGVMSNNTSCGFQTGTGVGNLSNGGHRYWRYVEGSSVVSHHPRVSRIILIDSNGTEHTIIKYTNDNCSDTGDYIIGTISYDFVGKWNDVSGTGNNFSLNNMTLSDNYMVMNGTNSFASIPTLNLTAGFTLETWTYMSSTSGGFGLFGQGVYGTGVGLHIFYDAGSRGMIYGMYSNDNDYNENYRPSNGQWYNWVFTYNGSSYAKRFYANSVLKTPGSSVQTVYSGTGQFNIGAIYGGPAGAYANGRISQVRIYNRPLSEAEVIQNFNSQKSRFGL